MANLLSQNEIAVLMGAISKGEVPAVIRPRGRSKGQAVQPENIKSFDFRHPIFLKDQLRTLQIIHESFARNFTNSMASYLRMNVQAKCIAVDQISYGEFVQSLPDPCLAVKIRVHPSESRALLIVHPTVAAGVLDRMAGGSGVPDNVNRVFTEIETIIIDELIGMAINDLEPAWNRTVKVSFTNEGLEYSAEFAQVATKDETVAAITLEVSFAETQGTISVCYPFRGLTSFIEKLSAKHSVEEEQKAQAANSRSNIEAAMVGVPLQLSARLGSAHLRMQDLLQLKRGDVLILDRSIDHTVDLEIAGRSRFSGHLGTHHGKTALLIEQRMM